MAKQTLPEKPAEPESGESLHHVLVVDDEPGIRDMLQWALREPCIRVDVAAEGEEAIRLLSEGNYALVITDLSMPKLDGLKLLEHVRSHWPQTKVIVITGFGTVETAVYAMRQKAFDFILKPFDLESLAVRIKKALSIKEGNAPHA